MGREIVYCEGCGLSLREVDFEKGRAREIDHRPWCATCRPPAAAAAPPSKSSIPRILAASSSTPRRAVPAASARSNLPVILGAAGGGLLLVVIVAAAASSGRPRPSPVERTATVPEPPRPAPEERRAAVPPPPVRRPAAQQREPEALQAPTEQERGAKLDAFLAQIRGMIAEDRKFERRAEIEGMIAAAEKTAGARLADVRAVRELHAKTFDDAAKAACDRARAEAVRLWEEKKRTEAVARTDEIPAVFRATRPAEDLRKWAQDLERRAAEAAVREREEAMARWKAWKVESGDDVPGGKILESHGGRPCVLQTHPDARDKSAWLERTVDVPAGKKSTLSLWVAPDAQGDWELRVLADGKELHKQLIGPKGSGWRHVVVDLTPLAGKRPVLRLENAPNDWAWEFGYWSDVEVRSE